MAPVSLSSMNATPNNALQRTFETLGEPHA